MPREIPALRGKTVKVFDNGDATYTAKIYAEPIHFRAPDDSWLEIDPTLVPSTRLGAAWENRLGPSRVAFAPFAHNSQTVVVDRDAESVGIGLEGASPIAPASVVGSRIVYHDVVPDVDLTFDVGRNGVKDALILRKRPDAPVSFRFRLSLVGLTAREEPNGEISLVSRSGQRAFVVPRGFMVDRRAGAAGGLGRVETTLSFEGGTPIIEVTPDWRWLRDPEREYPVTVDPALTSVTTLDAEVASSGWGSSSGTLLSTGLEYRPVDDFTEAHRSLFKFDLSPVQGKRIYGAQFHVYEQYLGSGASTPVTVYRAASDWNWNVSWWSQPGLGDAIGSIPGSTAPGWASATVTSAVQNWASGTWPNYGITLVGDEAHLYTQRYFNAADANYGIPHLAVTYGDPPYTPTEVLPANGTLGSATPTLSATYSDPDGDTGATAFHVRRSSDGALVAEGWGSTAASGQRSSWTVPAGLLQAGTWYHWYAINNDGFAWSPWTSGTAYLVNRPPSVPGGLTPPDGTISARTTPTLSATYFDPDGHAGRIRFELRLLDGGAVPGGIGEGTWVASGQASTWTVPTGVLTAGEAYEWFAQAWDGQEWSPASASTMYFVELAPALPPETVSASALDDTTFHGPCTSSCTPFSGQTLQVGARNEEVYKAALRFDLSTIPGDASVEHATLRVYVTGCLTLEDNSCPSTSHTTSVYGVTQDWHRSSPSWPAPTREDYADSSASIPAGAPPHWVSFDVTTAVRFWRTGLAADYGLLLERTPAPLGAGGVTIAGKDHADPNLRPRIDVTYTPYHPSVHGAPEDGFATASAGSGEQVTIWTDAEGTEYLDPEVSENTESEPLESEDAYDAGAEEPLHRYLGSYTAFPHSAIVYLHFRDGDNCTGFMINRDTALTAAHCVWTYRRDQDVRIGRRVPYQVSPARRYIGDWPTGHYYFPYGGCQVARLFRAPPDWHSSQNPAVDYAALRLDCDVGRRTGSFGFAAPRDSWWARRDRKVTVTGYPNRVHRVPDDQWRSKGVVRRWLPGRLRYTNQTVAGISGAPVYRPVGTRFGRSVVAIHGYGPPSSTWWTGARVNGQVLRNVRRWRCSPNRC